MNTDTEINAAVRERYAAIAGYLGVERPDPARLDFTRVVGAPGRGRGGQERVLLESFAYYKTGLSGNPLDPTPNFDAIARIGTLGVAVVASGGVAPRDHLRQLATIPGVDEAIVGRALYTGDVVLTGDEWKIEP